LKSYIKSSGSLRKRHTENTIIATKRASPAVPPTTIPIRAPVESPVGGVGALIAGAATKLTLHAGPLPFKLGEIVDCKSAGAAKLLPFKRERYYRMPM
jgi:hypothetical protein